MSDTVPVLPPSRVGRLMTHDPNKLHRNPNPGWHEERKVVVPLTGGIALGEELT